MDVRARRVFAQKWSLLGYLDVGTGGTKYSYQAIAGIGWNISKTFALELGYRLLAENYDKTTFLYDIRTAGPYLGLAIAF
jgi:opacity protein-like surface antigen